MMRANFRPHNVKSVIELQEKLNNHIRLIMVILNSLDIDIHKMQSVKSRIYNLCNLNHLLKHADNNYQINLCHYLSDLVNEITKTYLTNNKISLVKEIDLMDIIEVDYEKAVTIGLIVNELLASTIIYVNSILLDNENPIEIKIILNKNKDKIQLIISDNLLYKTEDYLSTLKTVSDFKTGFSIKNHDQICEMLKNLIEKIYGSLIIDHDLGSNYTINFPYY